MRCKKKMAMLAVSVAFWTILFATLATVRAQDGQTQGFRECTELCYARVCGEVGHLCPTVTHKRMKRIYCRGHCEEKMRRQEEERRIAEFNRRLAVERERAQRARDMILTRHRLWVEKREVVHRLRMEWEAAKQKRQAAAARAVYRRMQLAHDQEMQYMREKLQMKETFYAARQRMQHQQRIEMLRQTKVLHEDMQRAQKKGDSGKAKEIQVMIIQRKKAAKVAHKKEAVEQVNVLQTRVERHDHTAKQINVQRENLKEEKKEAQQKNDQKRLEELAKRLGELAGKQAAVARKAELDRIQLNKARTVLTSFGSGSNEVH